MARHSLATRLPVGWTWDIGERHVVWWDTQNRTPGEKHVAQFPFVPGFFVVVSVVEIGDDLFPTVSPNPIAGPFDTLFAAIGASRLMS